MASSSGDYQLAAAAAGFSLGFGILTAVKAFRQTKANRAPARSHYIYMIWGELIANLVIGILAWIFLKGIVKNGPVILFFILFFYVLEVQLLMQIIINRIAIITERRATATKLKIGTAIIISCINIAVFCIFIPSHLSPPVSELFVHINKYWDRCSKILIMIVDAVLNWYFIYIVKARLLKYHGLRKYQPLVNYYTRLGVVSILMDAMLIGLMSLPNTIVFIQFHPVAYLVKLNIEMSMADMIVKVARDNETDVHHGTSSQGTPFPESKTNRTQRSFYQTTYSENEDTNPRVQNTAVIGHDDMDNELREDIKGISRQTEVQIFVGEASSDSENDYREDDVEQGKTAVEPLDHTRITRNRSSSGSQIPLKDLALNRPHAL